MELRQRRRNRLKDYDYSRPGYYFITACIQKRAYFLGEIVSGTHDSVGRDDPGAPSVHLSMYGEIVNQYIASISQAYENVSVDKHVIMPNHIHLILRIETWCNGAPGSSRPTQLVPRIMSALKRFCNQRAGFDMWQTSYHDHIIHNEAEYLRISEYIETNPAKWQEDIYYAVPKGEYLL